MQRHFGKMQEWNEQMTRSVASAAEDLPAISSRDVVASLASGLSGMNWGSIDLNLLIVFDAVMHERNLTRAGRRLGLSQPATSHALARLRSMINDDLFVRTPDGMRPTPRAEQMAEPVRDALRALRVTLEPDAFDPAESIRGFALAANNYAARAIVPTLVRRVAEVAPNVTLDIRPVGAVDVLDRLDADGLDLALSMLTDGGERFKCARVMDDEYVAVFDRQHPAAEAAALSLEHLAELPHIAISSSGDDTSFIDEALEERGLARKIVARVPFLSIVLMLVGSDLVAVVPRRVATGIAAICPIAVKDLPFRSPRIGLSMIWHRRVDNHPAHRWLRNMIRASAQR
jgi:DNA-binding transcriptional LysR family regulator